jgi:hypothetical protein
VPLFRAALQVAADGSAVDGSGPSRHPKPRPPRAAQGQGRRRSRGRMTAPTIHVAVTHAKHIICSPGSRNLQAARHENNRSIDLKLFELIKICPLITLRDREEH